MTNIIRQALLITLLISLSSIGAYAADKKDGVTHISQQELAEKVKDPNVVLIDIRTQGEVNQGYIDGAVHLPIAKIINNQSLLDEYKDKDIVFYCHTGVRVSKLTEFLQQANHPSKDKLFHLKGDMRAWRARGNKVKKLNKIK